MLLEVKNLSAGYGRRMVIHAVSLHLESSEIVALIGHNGAGKSTTLKSIFGLIRPSQGQVLYHGQDISGSAPASNVHAGISFMPQERAVFQDLTVLENLEMGAYTIQSANNHAERLKTVHQLFPILAERSSQVAKTLSGGEQRMLSFGLSLMMNPQLILLDEPSLGLGPIFVKRLIDRIQEIRDKMGVAFIVVEQNVKQVLRVSDRVYVMKAGRIILEEKSEVLYSRAHWWELF
jgi:branched-chain amino acid transport system ATP-binding protein